jgi:hypothetical protein
MNIHLDRVTYHRPDEAESYIDQAFYGSLFIKHDPFRTENELRPLAYSVNSGAGVDVPVNVDLLVERLVLSPELSDWAASSVVEAIRNFGDHRPIERSSATAHSSPHAGLELLITSRSSLELKHSSPDP